MREPDPREGRQHFRQKIARVAPLIVGDGGSDALHAAGDPGIVAHQPDRGTIAGRDLPQLRLLEIPLDAQRGGVDKGHRLRPGRQKVAWMDGQIGDDAVNRSPDR